MSLTRSKMDLKNEDLTPLEKTLNTVKELFADLSLKIKTQEKFIELNFKGEFYVDVRTINDLIEVCKLLEDFGQLHLINRWGFKYDLWYFATWNYLQIKDGEWVFNSKPESVAAISVDDFKKLLAESC